MTDIFIPSYGRPNNQKTIIYLKKLGYEVTKLHLLIDDECGEVQEYKATAKKLGCKLHIFSMSDSIKHYDYIHRPSTSRRSAGQARNMIADIAKLGNISFYIVIDDDTQNFQYRPFSVYTRAANLEDITKTFNGIKKLMQKFHIGLFGLSQTGDMMQSPCEKILRNKVMNTTFYDSNYIYKGERGVQDDDTSQFASVMNVGLFTGSLASGLVLSQTASAKAEGGLTDLYNENKLLNKSLVVPIQFPSAVHAEKQVMNGNRLHHHIKNRYIAPKLMKGERSNIAWDTYCEDVPFTNEPKR